MPRKVTKPAMAKPGPGPSHRKAYELPDKIAGVAVTRVNVPYPTSNSGVDAVAPVTIPKAPWETNND